MGTPLLLNLSLPKCGTLSVHEFFSDHLSAHELYGNSVLTAIAQSREHENPILLTQLLRRRYAQSTIEIDTSGFLHAISSELIDLYPCCRFLRVIREPRSWISSYLDMLEGKARELTHRGQLTNDRAARFEQFYLQRITSTLKLSDLLTLESWTTERFSLIVNSAAQYWAEQALLGLEQLNHPQITTCVLEQLTEFLPKLRKLILPDQPTNEKLTNRARQRHNVSEYGTTRCLIEQWLKHDELNQQAHKTLDSCDILHKILLTRLQFPTI